MIDSCASVIVIRTCGIFLAVAVVVFGIWHFYRRYLIKMLKARFFNGSFILFHEKPIIKIITDGIRSEKPEIAAYYLRIAEEVGIKNWRNHLLSALDHDDDNIKEYALDRIIELRIDDTADILLKLAKNKKQATKIRNKSAYAYCLLSSKENIFQNLNILLDAEIAEGIITGFLYLDNRELSFIAMRKLSAMISDADENVRVLAAKIIGNVGSFDSQFVYPLTLLAYDESPKVKKQVIMSSAQMKPLSMTDYLVKRLYEADCRRMAFSTLISIGKDVISPLKDIINKGEEKTGILLYLVDVIGHIMGIDGKNALMDCLSKTKNRRVKDEILKVLEFHPLTIEKSFIGSINTLLNKETRNVTWLLSSLVDVEKGTADCDFKNVLVTAFKNDIEACKSRIISLCNLTLLPHEKVNQKNIGDKDNFDTLKANGIKFKKVELFANLPSHIILGRIDKDYKNKSKDAYKRLEEIIVSDSETTTKWLRACCCYMAFLSGKKSYAKTFEAAKNDPAQIVRETAIYALNNMANT